MEYQALYRKYRPKTFEEVYGQKIIVETLKNIVKNNKLTHAYLFIGPRGTGKTSIAKIFAKTINCLDAKDGISCEKCELCLNNNKNENVDIIEMDAASNNGVDEIREIKNHVTLLPTISKYKVYIIDEVHMLTTGAFNALLKTLEEPPKHVIFILATTEPHKIPLTIISRCQCFEFKPIPKQIIKDRLKNICENEQINIDEESLELIAIDSNGGMRDAIGLLDQLNAYSAGNIKYEDVLLLNGRVSDDDLYLIFDKIIENDLNNVFEIVDKIELDGKNFIYISEDMIKILRNELINYQTNKESLLVTKIGKEKILDIILIINKSINDMKNSKDKRIFFDILIMKIYDELKNNIQTNVRIKNDENLEKMPKNEKKEAKIEKKPQKIEKKVDFLKYTELMNIRLNNILSIANKQDFQNFSEKMKNIENEVVNLDDLRIANLLSDFSIKAASSSGIVLSTGENVLEDAYKEILNIDKMISEISNKEIKVCLINEDEWQEKRLIYVEKIKNKEKIDILDESDIIKKIKEDLNIDKSNEFEDLLEIGGE